MYNTDNKDKLIANVKKEVKQLMEEAVTKKYVHEESGSVTSLCAAVEACLSHGLKRRTLGLFKTSSTTALLHKIAKHCPEADFISTKVLEIEHNDPNKRSSSSSESLTKPPILKKNSSTGSVTNVLQPVSPTPKYLWIRLALFEKRLSRIIDHLVSNALQYYDNNALVADPDCGSILSSLLVGPCALDFTRAKTPDHFWTDPPADELIQRSRIGSNHPTTSPRPMLNYKRSLHTSTDEGSMSSFKVGSPASAAISYVESLHQNARATLLYGKNNVLVLPKDVDEPMPGYLSLHQNTQSLIIKWTPNQLMNGFSESENVADKSSYWAYALNINVDEIVYVHCHQARGTDTGGTIILVGQDGVQRPPIHFPEGGHMAQFLGCLETGLLPHGQLDPPLWTQRGIGRIFPWPMKTRRRPLPSLIEGNNDEMPIDYVFRVINKATTDELCTNLESIQSESYHDKLLHLLVKTHSIFEMGRTSPRSRPQLSSSSTNESSDYSSKSFSLDTNPLESPQVLPSKQQQLENQTKSIELVCTSMKKQIMSRAFYGWLAYCRHLKTVRTHLSELVHGRITPEIGAEAGLTKDRWENLHSDGIISDDQEVYRLVYYGGVEESIRKEVWPYLLGHYSFGLTPEQRADLDEQSRHYYETTMSEWLAVEAIVRQRDKEKTAHAVAKLSSSGGSGGEKNSKGVDVDADIENDVFEENGFSDLSDPEIDDDESTEKDRSSRKNSSKKNSGPFPITIEEKENNETKSPQSNSSRHVTSPDSPNTSSYETVGELADLQTPVQEQIKELKDSHQVIVTDASIDVSTSPELQQNGKDTDHMDTIGEEMQTQTLGPETKSNCVSPASSNGGIYSSELLENFGLNLHRIEKDVQRCDRNYWYFANENLDKLRNIICTYVWEHLDIGYMQGMCDLAAPLLVVFDDESLTYGCFCRFMERMIENFPNGGAMDMHFSNMRLSLIQILDSEMYELMQAHGDYTHFYFCYRWFLLDFKRELVYNDVFSVWETIWAAKHIASSHFVLFLALAFLETYRDIILSNGMDFTDIIKFFNEMAERHDAQSVLKLSRSLVHQLQTIIENK
uniref:CSON010949 protein n=1 Tax=Culicoides sonorensis TaxID=179676 RepID=A0A336LLF9_CULSO